MAEELKLLGFWTSPFSRRVELALKLKGIRYQYIEEDLGNKSPLLLESNPVHKKIPVLIHKGKPIAESLVILEYIEETWKDIPLLPQDPYGRARARFWAKFVDEKVVPSGKTFATGSETQKEQAIEEIHQHMKALENEVKGNEFFAGESLGYLDVVVFHMAYWILLLQEITGTGLLTEEQFPILYKWTTKLMAMDVVKECLPPRDKHVARMRARMEAMKSGSAPIY